MALAVFRVALVAVALSSSSLSVLRVRLDVLLQVIRAHEPLVAHRAGEALLARVSAEMPLQFVRPGEPFPAKEPVAHKRPLSGVPAQMRLQMRRLSVDLSASRDVATVDAPLPEMSPCRSQLLRFLAVWTVARGPTRVSPLRSRR